MPRTAGIRRWPIMLVAMSALVLSFGSHGGAAASAAAGGAIDPYDLMPTETYDYAQPGTDVVVVSQPDGSTFQARLTAQEVGGQLETIDGYTVVPDAEGWWSYAQPASDTSGSRLDASGKIVGRDAPRDLAPQVGRTQPVWLDADGNDLRDAAFDLVYAQSAPVNNRGVDALASVMAEPVVYRYVAVLVDFQDVKFEPYQTKEWFQAALEGVKTFPTGSFTDFYLENSYGKFQPEMEVYGPITSDRPMAWYDINAAGGHSVSWMLNNDIGPKIAGLVDWDAFDNDRVVYSSGGVQYRSVDMVVVIHAGPGQEATGVPGQIWSHASTANFVAGTGADGRQIRIRACNTTPATGFNIGVVCHEGGHSIGERDYYATNYLSTGTGDWDLMAGGSWLGDRPAGSNPTHMNPYSKMHQGWVTPILVTDTTTGIELRPRSLHPDIVQIPLGGSGTGVRDPATGIVSGAEESIFLEYVSNQAEGALFDKVAPSSGLLVWHYDAGGSQNDATRYRLAIEEYGLRDGVQHMRRNYNRGEPTDPWSDTMIGISHWTTPDTDRNTALGGTLATGWSFVDISPAAATIRLDAMKGEIDRVSVDRPRWESEPVIAGRGPAVITALVTNNTAQALADVKVRFVEAAEPRRLLAETTVPSIGADSVVAVAASWSEPVAGKHAVSAEVVAGDVTAVREARSLRVFARPAPVLLVDDDDNYDAQEAYEGALGSLGVPYVMVTGGAPLSTLQQYDLVVWHAGQAGRQEGQLTHEQIADLRAYLDAGGKLWIASPRLGAALASTGAAPGVDPAFYRDYFGSHYTMSSLVGGGVVTGLGNPIGGTASHVLRPYPGREVTDFIDPTASPIATVTPLFSWSYGGAMGVEVVGDEAHNGFRTVYFGFCLSQVVSGTERIELAREVLDAMGVATVSFEHPAYQVQEEDVLRLRLRDAGAAAAPVLVATSGASPVGVAIAAVPAAEPGSFVGELRVRVDRTGGRSGLRPGDRLAVLESDTVRVRFVAASGRETWATASVARRLDRHVPPSIYHDDVFMTEDAQPLALSAVVTDDVRVRDVDLYYRIGAAQALVAPEETWIGPRGSVGFAGHHAFTQLPGTGPFVRVKMTPSEVASRVYSAVVPASDVTEAGLEYFMVAEDSSGNLAFESTPARPRFVAVQPRTVGMP